MCSCVCVRARLLFSEVKQFEHMAPGMTFDYERNTAVLISQASPFPLNMMNGTQRAVGQNKH